MRFDRCNRCYHGQSYDRQRDLYDNQQNRENNQNKIRKEPKTKKEKNKNRKNKNAKLINNSRAQYQQRVPQNQIRPNVNVVRRNSIPEAPPPPPLPQRQIHHIDQLILDDSDDGEDSDSSDSDEEGEEFFEYVTAKKFLFFEYKKKMEGHLPKKLILLLMPYQNTVNTMTYRQYELLLKADEKVRKYLSSYLATHSVSEWQNLLEQIRNFYFSYKQEQQNYMKNLNFANSNVFEAQRKIYGSHTKEYVMNPWFNNTKKVLSYIAMCYVLYKVFKKIVPILIYYKVKIGIEIIMKLPLLLIRSLLGAVKARFTAEWNGSHTLIHSFPNLSRWVEEIIKIFPYGYKLVAYLEFLKYGHWGTYNWHKESSTWGFSVRLEKHKLKQYDPNRNDDTSLQSIYRSYTLLGTPPDFPSVVEELPKSILPARTLPIPKDKDLVVPYQVLNPLNSDSDTQHEGIFVMMFGVTTMVRPANTFDNQAATIIERITRYPNSKFSDMRHKGELLKIADNMVIGHIENPNWQNELSGVQKKNIAKVIQNHENGIVETNISCQIKNDEIINGKNKSVARFICNLSGEDFYYQGKLTSEISHWLADHWGAHGHNGLVYNNFMNKIYFTCGSNSSSLDYFVNNLIETNSSGQLVMGDDTWMLKNGPTPYIIENDFSRYDRTHHKGLRKIFDRVLCKNGYSELVMYREHMYKKTLKMRANAKKGDGRTLPNCNFIYGAKEQVDQLYTGEPATCLYNSFTNALTATYIFSEDIEDVNLYKADAIQKFDECGLICKDMQIHTDIESATFLKGVFLKGKDKKYHWIRLPSFLTKFGKVLKPHNVILKHAKNPNDRAIKLLKAQWLGYGNMKTNWYYKRIDFEINRICQNVSVESDSLEFWQVKQDYVDIEDEVWNNFMFSRYQITEEDMLEHISMLQTIQPIMLPCIYHVPILMKLIDRDY